MTWMLVGLFTIPGILLGFFLGRAMEVQWYLDQAERRLAELKASSPDEEEDPQMGVEVMTPEDVLDMTADEREEFVIESLYAAHRGHAYDEDAVDAVGRLIVAAGLMERGVSQETAILTAFHDGYELQMTLGGESVLTVTLEKISDPGENYHE